MAAPARLDALVLDLDTRAGLCAARQLGRGGYRLAVAAREPGASGLATRYALSRTVLPDPAVDFGEHVAALMALLREQPADVAIPSIDSSLEALQRNRDAIGRLTAPALGSHEAVEVALSKERTLEVARELGLATPRSLLVSSPEELEAAVAEMGMPCVLKPVTSWRPLGIGGERLSPEIVADDADVRRLGAAMAREDAPVLVQELAPGERETIKLFRHQGRVLARLAIVIDRTWPPLGGSSVMRRTTVPSRDARPRREARRRDRARRLLGGRVPPRRARAAAGDGGQSAPLAVARASRPGRAWTSRACSSRGARRLDPDASRRR